MRQDFAGKRMRETPRHGFLGCGFGEGSVREKFSHAVCHIACTSFRKAADPKERLLMKQDLSYSVTSQVPQILIAESHLGSAELLRRAIEDTWIGFGCDVCHDYNRAIIKLFHSQPPYKLVISGVDLAERNDFFLVKHNRLRQPHIPVVLTTRSAKMASSRRALEQGALDLILTPLDHEETVRTIRLALWQSKLKSFIAANERDLKKYRQHLAYYPPDGKLDTALHRTLFSVQISLFLVEGAAQEIGQAITQLSELATKVEDEVRKQAFERVAAHAFRIGASQG